MDHSSAPALDERLIRRVYSEYVEMPGLRLTARQAERLFGLSEHVCAKLLGHLVACRLLVLRPNGTYARPVDGAADRIDTADGMTGAFLQMTA